MLQVVELTDHGVCRVFQVVDDHVEEHFVVRILLLEVRNDFLVTFNLFIILFFGNSLFE